MKRAITIAAVVMAAISITACGSGGKESVNAPGDGTGEVTKLTYACPGKSARYNFVNEEGELDGYEIAIMKEVDQRLSDVTIDLIYTGEFSALFPGLESGQYDIIGGGISWKQERADSYLYSEVPYFHSPTVLGVRQEEDNIRRLKTLPEKILPT